MSVYQTVHTSSGPFVIAFPYYFCQYPRNKIPYSCILDYGRPVPCSLQLLDSVLLNQRYQSHLSRTSTWSYLTETNTSAVHNALTFYLLGNFWLLYLELYVHNNPDILTAQPFASTSIPSGDLRQQSFSARISGDALIFYRSLTRAQQTNIHRPFHAFRTQYAPNQDVLKAKVKALRQQPGQTIPAFFRELRDLARNAYPVEAVRNEILLTTFVAGLSNPTVGWEVRKAKPADADAALQAAVETRSFPEIDGLKSPTSGVNNISTESPLDTFTELVRTLRTEIQDAVAKSSRTDRNAAQNNQRDRSDSRDSNRYRSPHQDRDAITTFPTLKNPINPTTGTPPGTATVRGIILKFASQLIPKTTNETEVPVRSVVMEQNAHFVIETNIPAVSAKQVSIVAKLVTSGTNTVPKAKT